MASYDRFNIHAQLEHLQSKYQGTGHVDNTKWEWVLNIQRDTLSSHAGHFTRLAYFSIIENEPISKIRHRFLQVLQQHFQSMVKPVTNIKVKPNFGPA